MVFFGNEMLYPTLIYKAFYKFSHLNIHLSLFLGGHHLCVSLWSSVCPKNCVFLRSPRRLGHCRAPQSSAWFRVFYCAILVFLWLCCKVISCCFLSSTWWLSISQSKNGKCKWELFLNLWGRLQCDRSFLFYFQRFNQHRGGGFIYIQVVVVGGGGCSADIKINWRRSKAMNICIYFRKYIEVLLVISSPPQDI